MIQITCDVSDPKVREQLSAFLSAIERPVKTKPQPDQTPTEVKIPEVKPEPAKKPEPAPAPETEPAEKPAVVEAFTPSLEDLQQLVKKIYVADMSKVAEIKKALLEFGVSKVSELVADDYEAAYEKLKALEG